MRARPVIASDFTPIVIPVATMIVDPRIIIPTQVSTAIRTLRAIKLLEFARVSYHLAKQLR